MPTLVLPPRYTPESIAMWKAAIEAGWCVERLTGWRAPDFVVGQNIVLYGEPLFAEVMAPQLEIALLRPPLSWIADIPSAYKQRRVRASTLGEARTIPDPAFIKPANDKSFPAKVYSSGQELPTPDTLAESTAVLIAEPVSWEIEFRCFVLEQQVVAWSPYLRNNQLAQDERGRWAASDEETNEALELAGKVLLDPLVSIPPAFVLDVGRITNRGWAVVEANAAWGSGIYGCDPGNVLPVIQRACVRRESRFPTLISFGSSVNERRATRHRRQADDVQ